MRILLVMLLLAAPAAGAGKDTAPTKADTTKSAPKRPLPKPKGSAIPPDENMCFQCHTNVDQWDQKDPKSWRLYVPEKGLQEDVHFNKGKGVSCTDCHGGNHDTDKINVAHAKEDGFVATAAQIAKACTHCHKQQAVELVKGVHDKAGEKNDRGQGTPLACDKCHAAVSHHLLAARHSESPVFLDHQVKTCGGCHKDHLVTYERSVHGLGLYKLGLLVTASCSDCHGAHGIYRPADERSTLHDRKVAGTCGKCHRFIEERLRNSVHGRGGGPGGVAKKAAPGGKVKREPSCTDCHQGHELLDPESAAFRLQLPNLCGNCHAALSSRYAESLHGQLTELGYGPAAKCSDCHGAHDILPINDPNSRLSAENRLETCRDCHPNAVANFTEYDPHADHHDPEKDPFLHGVYKGMEILLYSVFGFFGAHALLWLVRSLVHTLRHGRPKRIAARQPAYVRFEPIHRTLHVMVIVSFLGLALTGLPLKYSDQEWGQALAGAMGGFDGTSVLHRICAVLTVFYAASHLSWLIKRIFQLREQGVAWRTLVFGPDSPVPNLRDFVDLYRMARWFVGLGPKPVFERWTYWEKFDYWAVFWGVVIIGTSGLILWFPNLFTLVLPGWVLNVAKIIHSEEALLATGFVFAIHFFNTHLRADKFPLDMAILTGLVTEAELREERPEFLRRMEQEGRLDRLAATAPSRRRLWLIAMGGFVALAIGLGLLAGMIVAGLGH